MSNIDVFRMQREKSRYLIEVCDKEGNEGNDELSAFSLGKSAYKAK